MTNYATGAALALLALLVLFIVSILSAISEQTKVIDHCDLYGSYVVLDVRIECKIVRGEFGTARR